MRKSTFKEKLNEIIFGTDTPAGQSFDLIVIVLILLSVSVLMLESLEIRSLETHYIVWAEWAFTIVFTIEYALRIYCSKDRWRYMSSFYGIVDFLSVIPTYLALFLTGANYLLVVRLIRVLRVFRVLRLVRYLSEANVLIRALIATRRKIFVFFVFVLVLSVLFGSVMYLVEGPTRGFTSIPKSIYWTIVTITTVGYGDITPQTPIGQAIAALAMLTGYSIIAVPTGILTAELNQEMQRDKFSIKCRNCGRTGHERDAIHCKFCGAKLP